MIDTKETPGKIKYKHLSFEQRVMIKTLVNEGKPQQYVAKITGCSQGTISRELRRNSSINGHGRDVYKPKDAQQIYKIRREKANFSHNLYVKYHRLIPYIKEHIGKNSPDIISKRLLKQEKGFNISTATIYNIILNIRPDLRIKLQFKNGYKKHGKNKKPRICPELPRIAMRSEIANNRGEIGHWEADSVVSIGHRGGVTTLSERVSRYMLIKRSFRLDASTALYNILDMLEGHNVLSITSDNGSEFAYLDKIVQKLDCDGFLCDPYCSWQKGTNEKNNREFRVHQPKGSDLQSMSDQELMNIQNFINHKPRKILGYKSAYEVYHNVSLIYG